jgi:hypothetical protein
MADGLDAAGQKKAIDSIADARRDFKALTGKGLGAPHILKITNHDSLRQIDVYFVVYGNLEYLMNKGITVIDDAKKPADPALAAKVDELGGNTLEDRQIVKKGEQELYYYSYFPLLERVRMQVTLHGEDTRADDSVLLATVIDERFDKDEKYGNLWQTIVDGKEGMLALDPKKHVYNSAGGYIKATQLVEPQDAIFVEYHFAFEEPEAWFGAKNFLGSKLPAATDKAVRKIRTQLAKEEEKRAKSK